MFGCLGVLMCLCLAAQGGCDCWWLLGVLGVRGTYCWCNLAFSGEQGGLGECGGKRGGSERSGRGGGGGGDGGGGSGGGGGGEVKALRRF